MFDDHQADALALAWSDVWGNVEADDHVVQSIVRHASQARLLARLPVLRRQLDTTRPLGPNCGMSGRAAFVLAAQSGIGLDIDLLADLLELQPERVAQDLFDARVARDPEIGNACARHAVAIGGYNDRAIDHDDRLALLSHAQHCAACRDAIERSQVVDADLQAEVREIEESLPAIRDGRPRAIQRAAQRLLLGAGAVILLASIVMVGIAVDRLFTTAHEPVAAAIPAAPRFSGWLVQQNNDGYVSARNLATGEVRALTKQEEATSGLTHTWPAVSPSGTRLAYYEEHSRMDGSQQQVFLEVRDLSGNLVMSHEWEDGSTVVYPLGWINDDTILFVRRETPQSATDTAPQPPRTLFTVSVPGGEEREIFSGAVDYASVSPDASLIAMFPEYQQDWPGQTLEIRPLGPDGVGQPIATLEHRVVSSTVWAKDSSALYVTTIADAELRRRPTPDPTSSGYTSPDFGYDSLNLVRMSRDGTTQVVLGPDGQSDQIQPLTTSPDGASIIYAVGTIVTDQSGQRQDWAYWRANRDGSNVTRLLETGDAGYGAQPLWSPDGENVLLSSYEPFYLGEASNASMYPPYDAGRAATYVAVGPDGKPQTIPNGLGGGGMVLAWLAADALPANATSTTAGDLTPSGAEPVDGLQDALRVKPWSAAAQGNNYVLLQDSDRNMPTVWDRIDQRARRLLEGSSDISWLPDTQLAVGTVPYADAANRLIFYGPESDGTYQTLDFQRFDPANLGSDRTKHYAKPLVSPGGAAMSFFVVDDGRNRVALWVAGWDMEPKKFAEWSIPDDAIPDVPLTGAWLNDSTLLFTEPDRWVKGMPTRSVLMRLTIEDNDANVEQLTTLDGRGNDQGIAIMSLAMNRDETLIAYRMRHFTARADDHGRIDMIHVMSVDDVTRSIEIARGTPGDSLSWSPNGQRIVADIDQRVALLSPDGRTLDYLTPDSQHASSPFWVDDHEVWFAADGGEIWRVTFSAER
jgi:Tol biopolymer transport system component